MGKVPTARCRKVGCTASNETLTHILNMSCICESNKKCLIRRHDSVVRRLHSRIGSKLKFCSSETPLADLNGRIIARPDIIGLKGDRALIFEVSIPTEVEPHDSLIASADTKLKKYSNIQVSDSITRHFKGYGSNVTSVSVIPVIVGARGTYQPTERASKATIANLKALGIRYSELYPLLALTALEGSLFAVDKFLQGS
jgi:hypothetical protein